MTTGNNRLKSSGVIKKAQTTNQTKSLHLTITTLKNITITNERWKVEGGRWKVEGIFYKLVKKPLRH